MLPWEMNELHIPVVLEEETLEKISDKDLPEQVDIVLRTIYDPEIDANIVELGLVYDVKINPDKSVAIDMTLTAPNCPVADKMPDAVQQKLMQIPGVGEVTVNMVWEPTWHPSMMSDGAKLHLNMLDYY